VKERHDEPLDRSPEDDALDDLVRSARDDTDPHAAARVATTTLARLRRRRRKLVVLRTAAAAATVAVAVTALWLAIRTASEPRPDLALPRHERVETEGVDVGSDSDVDSERRVVATPPRSPDPALVAVERALDARRRLDHTLAELRGRGTDGVDALVAQLGSPNRRDGRHAAQLLVRLDTPESERALLDIVESRPESRDAQRLLVALRDAPRYSQLLGRVLATPGIDAAAARHFSGRGERDGTESLEAVLRGDTDAARRLAFRLLAARDASRAAAYLVDLASPTGDPALTTADLAILVGGVIADLSGDHVEALAAALEHRWRPAALSVAASWPDRLAAALGESGRHEAWPLLQSRFRTLGPDRVSIDACGALADPHALDTLESWTRLADERGAAAIDAIARIPGDDAIRTLLSIDARLASGTHVWLPAHASNVETALRRRSAEAVRLLVEETLQRGRAAKRAIAALGRLARLDCPDAVQALVEALERPAVRATARRSLARAVGSDLGPRAAAWQLWLREWRESTAPGRA